MNPFVAVYYAIQNLRNSADFAFRQRFHTSPNPVVRTRPANQDFLSSYPLECRERAELLVERLTARYHLADFSDALYAKEIKENYFYLAMLDEAFHQSHAAFPPSINAADIGPSSWFYVRALIAALTWYNTSSPRAVRLTGYEVDAFRLFADFHTRKDHALGNMQGLSNVEYIDRGFGVQPETYDLVTLFFPFVFKKDHLQWGLPLNLFDPVGLNVSAWRSLRSGGLMIIVNQGKDEHRAQIKMLEDAGISITAAFHMEPLLYTYRLDRYIITAKK